MVATHPAAQRVYALALFLQTLVLVLPFAWWRNSDAKPWTASLWLVASAAPFLAGHEPRYYAPALVPLALLAADGFRRAADVLFGARFRYAWVALLSTSALVSRAFLIPLMPHEVEQSRLLKLYHLLHARSPNATYFIPWISDYSLLRFAFPNDSIMLCLSNLPGSRHFVPGHGSAIAGPDQWWVGADHYVGSRSALLERSQPWYYVGWSYNPAALRLERLLRLVGGEALMLKGRRLHDHLAGSWIWHDRSLALSHAIGVGQYQVYRVTVKSPDGPVER
jgi:hypothetical protein